MAQNKTKAEIIAENEALLKKVEELEKLGNAPASVAAETGGDFNRYMQEMESIRQKGRVEAGTIQVQEFADHKNISLWTPDGKRIGPMHRANALEAFRRFWGLGIKLSSTQPTNEQIEIYKRSDEYKNKQKALKAIRARKNKSRKSGQIEKLAESIANMTGQTVDAINNVFQSNEIKSLSEGRAKAGVKD